MSTLTSTQQKVLESIRYFIRKFGAAYPSYDTLAAMVRVSSRHVVDLIKQLVELGLIRKVERWGEVDGRRRQLSNAYELVESEQPEQEEARSPEQSVESQEMVNPSEQAIGTDESSPYKRSFKNISYKTFNKPEGEDARAREGSYLTWLLRQYRLESIRDCIVSRLPDVDRYEPRVLQYAVGLAYNLMRVDPHRIVHPPAWIVKAIKTAALKISIKNSVPVQA